MLTMHKFVLQLGSHAYFGFGQTYFTVSLDISQQRIMLNT